MFGEHAREIITSEVGLWLARLLLQDHRKVAEWPSLHAALERVERQPAEGWPKAINTWLEDVLKKVIVQVRRQVVVGVWWQGISVILQHLQA